MKRTYSNFSKTVLTVLFILFFISFLKQHTMLLIAQSESLPYRYFLLIKNSAVKKGDLIAIQNHPLADISNVILTKKLIGLPGDQITLHGRIMRVNQEWQGALHKQNSQGYPLTPLNVSTIPAGFVFVAGLHAGSLDSRYAEFGLVEKRHILGRVYGLW